MYAPSTHASNTLGDCVVLLVEAQACVRARWNYEFHSGLRMESPCLMDYACQPGSKAIYSALALSLDRFTVTEKTHHKII